MAITISGDAATTRTSLGLGSAATLDAGTGANQIVQLDGSGNLPALNGAALTGIVSGNYSIHEFDEFSLNQSVNGNNGNYFKISNGNYVTFTPQSTNDIIYFNGSSQTYNAGNGSGGGIYVGYGTSSTLNSGNISALKYPGTHVDYDGSGGDIYRAQKFTAILPCTNLTVGTQYYAELVGSAHASSSTTIFGYSVSGVSADAVTYLQMIHYTRN